MDAWIRREAARSLGHLGRTDDATLAGLRSLASDAQVDAEMRSAAAEALDELGRTDEATPILLALARDTQIDGEAHPAVYKSLKRLLRSDQTISSLSLKTSILDIWSYL